MVELLGFRTLSIVRILIITRKRTWEKIEMHIGYWWGSQKEGDH
jgi:hypothetical protein